MRTETPRLSLTLKDIHPDNEQPLDEVFAEALRLLNRLGVRPGEADDKSPLAGKPLCSANWLAKWCIRAVCEAVIKEGLMPLPLAVDMRWKSGGRDFPSVPLPVLFVQYARQQGVKPRFLAGMIIDQFMAKAPAKLTFRTSYPLDPGEVMDR